MYDFARWGDEMKSEYQWCQKTKIEKVLSYVSTLILSRLEIFHRHQFISTSFPAYIKKSRRNNSSHFSLPFTYFTLFFTYVKNVLWHSFTLNNQLCQVGFSCLLSKLFISTFQIRNFSRTLIYFHQFSNLPKKPES